MAKVQLAQALRKSRTEFERLLNLMSSMHTQFQIRPSDPSVIQVAGTTESPESVRIGCAPVVCKVPERASHTGDASLYIVLTGQLEVALASGGELTTKSFATNFAYFEVGIEKVTHRLGGHYDYSTSPLGHPSTHLQLRSQVKYFDYVAQNFTSVGSDMEIVDLMRNVLTQFRAPSAQVDFLGFLLQVGADHLIDSNSDAGVKAQFSSLANSCSPIFGIDRPNDGGTCSCARSVHLYPK